MEPTFPLNIWKNKVLLTLHIQILFGPHFGKTHLPVGLIAHNFWAKFEHNMIFELNGAVDLHTNLSHWHHSIHSLDRP